jgi:hypothetical protein
MNKCKRFLLEVKCFPESQDVLDNDDWFLIMDASPTENRLGYSSYARLLDESEYILVEKTTADEFNSAHDPGDEDDRSKKRSMISSIGYRGEE